MNFYHGSPHIFENFKLNKKGMLFFSSDIHIAEDFGMNIYNVTLKDINNTFDVRKKEHISILLNHFKTLSHDLLEEELIKDINNQSTENCQKYFLDGKTISELRTDVKKLEYYYNLTGKSDDDIDIGQNYCFVDFVYNMLISNYEGVINSILLSEDSWLILENEEFGIIEHIKSLGFDSFTTCERVVDNDNYNICIFDLEKIDTFKVIKSIKPKKSSKNKMKI